MKACLQVCDATVAGNQFLRDAAAPPLLSTADAVTRFSVTQMHQLTAIDIYVISSFDHHHPHHHSNIDVTHQVFFGCEEHVTSETAAAVPVLTAAECLC